MNFSSHTTDYNLTSYENHGSPSRKRHGMVLNLGSKSANVFGGDQTPTPTRIIRNCEELGLFQDLQNVNPFEETFRKAVEQGKTGISVAQSSRLAVLADDTLHTPHVFPHIIENDLASRSEPTSAIEMRVLERRDSSDVGEVEIVENCHRSVVKVVKQEADTSQLRHLSRDSIANADKSTSGSQSVPLILKMPDGRLMQVNATPVDMDHSPVTRMEKNKAEMSSVILHTPVLKQPSPMPATSKPETENISPLIKQKLKARLGSLSASNPSMIQNVTNQKLVKICPKESGRMKRSSSMSNASNSDDDEETKRQKFLERNRAAAHRCRQKRKFWVEQLEKRAEMMMVSNQQLQLEVTSLKAEVARLKTLLLAHKDCSVTRALCYNDGVSCPQVVPVDLDQVAPVHIIKPLSEEETQFRKNLKKKLRTVSVQKPANPETNQRSKTNVLPKKKRLSLNIESAKQSTCILDEKNSPIVRNDKFLTCTLSTEPSELESLHKPVATQVITLNPNVLFREGLRAPTPPHLLSISPQSPPCI